jgi:SAM-dependent methyltransferase
MTEDTPGETTETAESGDGGLAPSEQRSAVRDRYASLAATDDACCGDPATGCCDDDGSTTSPTDPPALGYSDADLDAIGEDAALSLGCGNPAAIASLDAGETVLDLGSGAGFDCFLAAEAVGPTGRVIGVDMTPAMVERARENRADSDADHVEFRLGEIEHLPVADGSVDVVISNCVVNLSPAKPQVFRDAYRVLRPGGRLAISDVVVTTDLPADLATDPESVAGCVGGASSVPDLESMLADAGFRDVAIEPKADSAAFISEWDPERDLSDYVVAATIEAKKPTEAGG